MQILSHAITATLMLKSGSGARAVTPHRTKVNESQSNNPFALQDFNEYMMADSHLHRI